MCLQTSGGQKLPKDPFLFQELQRRGYAAVTVRMESGNDKQMESKINREKETADQGLAVQALDLAGSALQKELTGDGTDLWDDLKLMEKSSHITTAFRRIRIMALAYQSDFLEETYCREPLFEIIYGCLTRMKHYYRKDMELFGNWWDYDIGGAQALMDSLVLIFEKLASDQELLSHYLETVHTFVPVPRWAVRPISGTFGDDRCQSGRYFSGMCPAWITGKRGRRNETGSAGNGRSAAFRDQ